MLGYIYKKLLYVQTVLFKSESLFPLTVMLAASQPNHLAEIEVSPLLGGGCWAGPVTAWSRGRRSSRLPPGDGEKQVSMVDLQLQPELCVFLNSYCLEIVLSALLF